MRRRPKLEVPVKHIAVGIDSGLGLDHHGRAVGFPLVLLGSRVLELDGFARHRGGEKRRVGGGVVGHVVAIAAGARNVWMQCTFALSMPRSSAIASPVSKTLWLWVWMVITPSSPSWAMAAEVPIDPCI